MCRFSYFISTVCELFLGSVFLFSSVLLFVLVVSGMQRCVSTWRSGVSGTAGLHAAHRAGEADHGLLPARVPGGAHSSGTAGHGSVWAFQHSCQGTQHPTHHNPSPRTCLCSFLIAPLSVINAVWSSESGGPSWSGDLRPAGAAPREGGSPSLAGGPGGTAPLRPGQSCRLRHCSGMTTVPYIHCSWLLWVHEGSWSAIIFSFVCAIKSFCQMKQRKSTLYSKQVTEWNVTVKSGRWRKLCDAVVFMAGQPCFDWCPTLSSILPQRPHSARV